MESEISSINRKLPLSFFQRDVLEVAPDLLGKYIVRKYDDGRILRLRITEVEAYRGEEDKACHAAKGRTKRTDVMYCEGGVIYVYLIYGMYWLLNFVTGDKDNPQAVLIRAVDGMYGPGRVGRLLELDVSFRGDSVNGSRLWVEGSEEKPHYKTAPRIGIGYAQEWKDVDWRFYTEE